MSNAIIRVENLKKTFQDEGIIKGITCEFTRGEIHAVIGNNGSGKSVFFKCICGFIAPTEGHIFVDGREIGKDIDFPKSIGIIIERPGFLTNLTGYKNLQLLAGINNTITGGKVREAMHNVGLDPDSKKAVAKYSLGMKQRLGIAQAIMENPDILILDEPFNGLDKEGVADIRRLIQEIKSAGKTILLTSHNTEDIKLLADNIWEMDAGLLTDITR